MISSSRSVRSGISNAHTTTTSNWDYDEAFMEASVGYSLAASMQQQQQQKLHTITATLKAKSLGVGSVVASGRPPLPGKAPRKSTRRSAFFWHPDAPDAPNWTHSGASAAEEEEDTTQENTDSSGADTPVIVMDARTHAESTTNIYIEDNTYSVLTPELLAQSHLGQDLTTTHNRPIYAETASSISVSLYQAPLEIAIPDSHEFPPKPTEVKEPQAPLIPTQEDLEAAYEAMRRQHMPSQQDLAKEYHRNVLQEHRRRRRANHRNSHTAKSMRNITIAVATHDGKIKQRSMPNIALLASSSSAKKNSKNKKKRNGRGSFGKTHSRNSKRSTRASRLSKSSSAALFGGETTNNDSDRPRRSSANTKKHQQQTQRQVQQRSFELGLDDEVQSMASGVSAGRFLLRRTNSSIAKVQVNDELHYVQDQHHHEQDEEEEEDNLMVVTTANGDVELLQVPPKRHRKRRSVLVQFLKASWKFFFVSWKTSGGTTTKCVPVPVVEEPEVESDDDCSYYRRQDQQQRRQRRRQKRRGSF